MKNYLIAACILISAAAAAQQKPQYTQYMINPFVLNPAVSGTEDYADIRAGYRKQWTGFDGSPRTFYLSAHTNIGKNLVVNNRSRNKKNGFHGIGLLATNDVIGATSNTTISGAYSYHLALTKKLFASLGVMGGLQQFALDAGKLNTTNPNDPLINSFNNTALADINTGFWIYSEKFISEGRCFSSCRRNYTTKPMWPQTEDCRSTILSWPDTAFRWAMISPSFHRSVSKAYHRRPCPTTSTPKCATETSPGPACPTGTKTRLPLWWASL